MENITIIDNLENDTILGIGTKLTLKVSTTTSDAPNPNVDWMVENISGTASIDKNGLLATSTPGRIKVIAKAPDGSTCIGQKEYLIAIPVFIQQDVNLQSINIFSIPTKDKLQIEIDKLPVDGILIEIRDIKGQILIKKRILERRADWSLGNYKGSIYFVILTDNKNVWTKKIVQSANSK